KPLQHNARVAPLELHRDRAQKPTLERSLILVTVKESTSFNGINKLQATTVPATRGGENLFLSFSFSLSLSLFLSFCVCLCLLCRRTRRFPMYLFLSNFPLKHFSSPRKKNF